MDAKIFTERPPRTMWVAGQNETIRKTAAQNGFPATVGLEGCVAIIIADKKGNVSITHVDADTDLSFIKNEIAFMDGEYTIDIIKKPGKGNLDLKVLTALDEMGLSQIPASGKQRVLESDEGTVVYNHLKKAPQVFSFNDFKEIATPGITPKETNKLLTLGYSVETCVADPLRFQLRVYSRQLNQALSSKPTALPVLVHDSSGWLETEVKIDKEVELILNKGEIHHQPFFQSSKMQSLNHVLPRYTALVKHLELQEKKISSEF
ncbi:hypothetical protein LEAN103870_14875 [Legionella anisa]|uniref:hypothetical protein n=1 Tax=Legionella anisa TaxID=28082 RepID=UPI00036FECC3|nr:hypothetical protein [Legionella anisa]KTC70813.1 hypothetical protein Lani_2360 [Legionella anisa]MCW8426383.1 hypothetical protein [Legionella anisa]MCW8448043.1 hypothetical protein [Legionella anisa]UAK78670.1 hypothetical protein K8O89_13510 [Legionella anisa]